MGSVSDFTRCPKCAGIFRTEYWYKTGEEFNHCERCGYSQSARMKRDEKYKIVREDVAYPLDGSTVFGIKREEKLVWEKPLTIESTQDDIAGFLNAYSFAGPDYAKRTSDWIRDTIAIEGNKNIYHKTADGTILQLFFIGNRFRFQRNERGDTCFYLEKAVWEIEEKPGNGVILAAESAQVSSFYNVNGMTKAEVIRFWNEIQTKDRPFDTSADYATFRDPEIGELVCLFGKMPLSFDEFVKP